MTKKETNKSFVLRIDAESMEAIEKWAADEFRSTNGQLLWIIAEALKKSGRIKKIGVLINLTNRYKNNREKEKILLSIVFISVSS